MMPIRRYAVLALLLSPGLSVAQAPQGQPQGKWFTPPPAGAAAPRTVDMTGPGAIEEVTVVAQRASRSWRSQVTNEHLNDPLASDAARPRDSFVTPTPYCNSTMRTVGGQPASAADVASGSGAGKC